MRLKLTSEDFSEKQIQILNILFEKEYQQKELQEQLCTSAPNLHYHLNRLEELYMIRKKTLYEVGNVKINSISLNPAARQQVRKILGKDVKNYTLITGFGSLKTGYRVPDLVLNILRKYKFPITRIICFTTPDGKVKRYEHITDENLIKIDEFVILPYKEYRHTESEFFQRIEDILSKEMKEADIIIDITPLSKLFSFKLLELANKYLLPCVYLGIDKNEEDKLFWMGEMRIEGEIQPFV